MTDEQKPAEQESETPQAFYVASRASVPERPAMWQRFRAAGFPIISTWIDEAGPPGETADLSELWERIHAEIARSTGLVLYAERGDFPLKGAFIEVGIALALNKPISVVLDFEPEGDSMRPIGSWITHKNVTRERTVEQAFESVASRARELESALTARERDALDAKRYRWIRENADVVECAEWVQWMRKYGSKPEQLDYEVDAGMDRAPSTGGS